MGKYVCSVCEFIYDEATGIPEAGIAPGTSWADLPDNWTCPQCGATKAEFTKQSEPAASNIKNPTFQIEASSDFKEMSPLEIRALCKNLARGCEKQYKPEKAALFNELADYFKVATAPAKDPDFGQLLVLIEKDLEDYFPNAKAVAADVKDRGALRALTWDEKVTRILKSLLTRYQDKGEDMLENTSVYVCTICGFIYVGDNLPDVCPVCKVPNWKFEKVEGR